MGSLGTGELMVIAVVALIVFGPKRLPELARKAGELLTKTREATKSITSALDTEYDGITAPLQDLKKEYDSTVKGIKDAASSATNFSVDLSGKKIDAPASAPETVDTTGADRGADAGEDDEPLPDAEPEDMQNEPDAGQ